MPKVAYFAPEWVAYFSPEWVAYFAPESWHTLVRIIQGAPAGDKFTSSLIKKSKIVFRPGIEIRNMLATVTYTKE